MLIYSYWYNNLIRYYISIDTANYYVPILLLIQQSICYNPSNKLWYNTLNTKNTAWLSMNKAAACPPLEDPRRCAHQERLGGRQANYPRLWILCYYIVVFLFCHLCYRYLPLRRHISRVDAHRMYPRYPRVFSLCYNILPTPPPISVRKAGGITVVYLCGFQPFMLN